VIPVHKEIDGCVLYCVCCCSLWNTAGTVQYVITVHKEIDGCVLYPLLVSVEYCRYSM
jgi:hypothetical protein